MLGTISTTTIVGSSYMLIVNPTTVTSTGQVLAVVGSALYGSAGTSWSVTNMGSLFSAGGGAAGVKLVGGGSVDNQVGAVITAAGAGHVAGVSISGGPGTVRNAGLISGYYDGVYLDGAGSVTNLAGGHIDGNNTGVRLSGVYTNSVVNAGTISGAVVAGDSAGTSSAHTLSNTGLISSISFGGRNDLVTNAGTITSSVFVSGGSVVNQAGGLLGGVMGGDGIVVSNSGTIQGAAAGVAGGYSTTVFNNGLIQGGTVGGGFGVAGIYLQKGGFVLNGPSGVIAGYTGIAGPTLYGFPPNPNAQPATIDNAGTIEAIGSGATNAIFLPGGVPNLVIDRPGAVFIGAVNARNRLASTLELASGTSVGTLTGLGTQFINFGQTTVDAGATWVLSHGNTISSDTTLTNSGTLTGGITLAARARLTNTTAGTISVAAGTAIYGTGDPSTILNAGIIEDLNSGSRQSDTEVRLSAGGTLINIGTITGAGTAVSGDGNALVVMAPGAIFQGEVNGGSAAPGSTPSTFELTAGTIQGIVRGFGSQFLNFGSIQFDAGSDWILSGNTTGIADGETISGFGFSDTIEITGVTEAFESFSNGTLSLTGSENLQILLTGAYDPAHFLVTDDGANTEITVTCFAAGTRIATPDGTIAVEALAVGDLVSTHTGSAKPIIWVGHRHIDCRTHPDPRLVWPIRVRAGAFGPKQPTADLYLSPEHCIYINDVLIPVKHLINGLTIAQVQCPEVRYYHLELPRHDLVIAEGLAVESYLDTDGRRNFANGGGVVRLFPDFASLGDDTALLWEAMGFAPRQVVGPEVEAARSLLLQRARQLAATVTAADAAATAATARPRRRRQPTTAPGVGAKRPPAVR